MVRPIVQHVTPLAEAPEIGQPIVCRVAVQMRGGEHDTGRAKPRRLHQVGPARRTATAVTPGSWRTFACVAKVTDRGPEGPSVRKRTVRNGNTDGIPSILTMERPNLFRFRRELLVCCVQSWRANGIGRDVAAAAGALHATNRGPNAGVHFACNTRALGQSSPSIPYRIDGAVPHPARPPTLRASRYRTFSHGWAFRPIEPDHDQSFGVPKCGHCQGGVAARRAVDRWSARSAGCRAAPERQIGLAGGQGRWTSIPARPGRRPRLTPLASTTPGG